MVLSTRGRISLNVAWLKIVMKNLFHCLSCWLSFQHLWKVQFQFQAFVHYAWFTGPFRSSSPLRSSPSTAVNRTFSSLRLSVRFGSHVCLTYCWDLANNLNCAWDKDPEIMSDFWRLSSRLHLLYCWTTAESQRWSVSKYGPFWGFIYSYHKPLCKAKRVNNTYVPLF